jgi:hypothetical protein
LHRIKKEYDYKIAAQAAIWHDCCFSVILAIGSAVVSILQSMIEYERFITYCDAGFATGQV